jgi:uncharacterized protein YacL (UPF0231 family)
LVDFTPRWRFLAERLGLEQLFTKLQQLMHWHHHELRQRIAHVEQQLQKLEKSNVTYQAVSKGTQIALALQYRELASQGKVLKFSDVEFRNFSQTGEDGILHYIFSLIGTHNKKCVEICAGAGNECISANLILNHGWYGLLVDGDPKNVETGQAFYRGHPDSKLIPPCFLHRWVSRESVNAIIEEPGFDGEIDLLTIDMDGIDYWIWDAITVTNPRVVVVEFLAHFPDRAITVPYRHDFVGIWIPYEPSDVENDFSKDVTRIGHGGKLSRWSTYYGGASLGAFIKLGKRKGYRLIGANSTGYNAFFLRDDVAPDLFPEVEESTCYNRLLQSFIIGDAEKLKNYEFQEV